jgi:lysozyme
MFAIAKMIQRLLIFLSLTGFIILSLQGYFWPNNLFAGRYPIRGIDVSNHQQEIDWEKVGENKDIRFAFIKATEGQDYQDKFFEANWHAAGQVGILRGAYHYFTLTSSGKDQAANFISVVPLEKGCLPPVIDVEVTGADRDALLSELHDLVDGIEEAYGQTPILYVVYATYDEYIKGEFDRCPVWIRDIVKPPLLSGGAGWQFWQYCSRGHMDGIRSFVDLNAFYGSMDELESLLSK